MRKSARVYPPRVPGRQSVRRAIEASSMAGITAIRSTVAPADLAPHALEGEMVKAVVDVRRSVMAVGGELHSDEEQTLLDDGSAQGDLWGISP